MDSVVKFSEWLRSAATPVVRREGGDEEQRRGLVAAFCLFASVLLWFTFSMRGDYTRVLEVPLEVVNLAEGDALLSPPPLTARAQVEGQGIQLLRLYYNRPTIPIDASLGEFDLMTSAPEVFSNVRLDAITPRVVSLAKDRKTSKRVPIRSRVSIVPPPGHHVGGTPELRPDSVTVSGASTLIDGLTNWPTRRLQVQPAGDSVSVSVSLSDSLSRLVSKDVSVAVYAASVREFTEGSRTVNVRVTGAPEGQMIQFDPPTVKVIYQVALDQYALALQAPDFYAEVPYEAILADQSGSVVPNIHYPEGVEFREYRLDPPSLGYYFELLFD